MWVVEWLIVRNFLLNVVKLLFDFNGVYSLLLLDFSDYYIFLLFWLFMPWKYFTLKCFKHHFSSLRSAAALFNTSSFTFLKLELFGGFPLLLNSLIYLVKWFYSLFAACILTKLVLISLPKARIVLNFLKP